MTKVVTAAMSQGMREMIRKVMMIAVVTVMMMIIAVGKGEGLDFCALLLLKHPLLH